LFEQPKYIQNSFSIFFPEQRGIAQKEQEIFSKLRGRYFQPRSIAAASGSDTEAPGLLFASEHGHSHIVVSTTTAILNVSYSADWQTRPAEAREYMVERTGLLFDVLEAISEDAPLFGGSVTRAQVPSIASDEDLASFVARVFAGASDDRDYHDIIVRSTVVVDDLFFSNLTVQNYRFLNVSLPAPAVFRVSRHAAVERGLEVVSDFNSRYAFNEDRPFQVTRESALIMLDKNFEVVQRTIDQAKESAQ